MNNAFVERWSVSTPSFLISKFVFSNLYLESPYNQIRHKQSLKNKGSHIHINIITVVESTTRRDVTNKTKIIAYKLKHKRVSCAINIVYAVQRKLIIVGKTITQNCCLYMKVIITKRLNVVQTENKGLTYWTLKRDKRGPRWRKLW